MGNKNSRQNRPITGYIFSPLASGKKCNRCGNSGSMVRTHRQTLVVDTRHLTCFECVPNWNESFNIHHAGHNCMMNSDYDPFERYALASPNRNREE